MIIIIIIIKNTDSEGNWEFPRNSSFVLSSETLLKSMIFSENVLVFKEK